ncbi:MAG: hypothetical protein MZV70_73265 [Desulfobacterales bacterium]|nr:hypothetical protein [Desulfobacterales bacterium]
MFLQTLRCPLRCLQRVNEGDDKAVLRITRIARAASLPQGSAYAFFFPQQEPEREAENENGSALPRIHLGAENSVQMRNWKEVCSKFWRMKMKPNTTATAMPRTFVVALHSAHIHARTLDQ